MLVRLPSLVELNGDKLPPFPMTVICGACNLDAPGVGHWFEAEGQPQHVRANLT